MRDGSTGVPTHIAHARLKKRLGDGENPFAAQDVARSVAELLDVLAKVRSPMREFYYGAPMTIGIRPSADAELVGGSGFL